MLLQPEPKAQSRRIVAPAAVGVLMTFLWSGQLALATTSCAGTRSEHAHEHHHATCETKAATPDHGAAHAHGQPSAKAPSDEQHVIVLRGGESKVVKQGAAAEIQGAWRAAVEGEPQVIVLGPDGEKRVHGLKLRKSDGAEEKGKAHGHGGVWRFHSSDPEGKAFLGRVEPLKDKTFELQFDHGKWAELGKVYGEAYKQGYFAAPGAHKHAEGKYSFGRAAGGDGDLDALRRELEETRAALEEQRQALEELRRQLEEQRSRKSRKAETVGALMR